MGFMRVQHYIRMTMQITSNLMLPNLLYATPKEIDKDQVRVRERERVQECKRKGKIHRINEVHTRVGTILPNHHFIKMRKC